MSSSRAWPARTVRSSSRCAVRAGTVRTGDSSCSECFCFRRCVRAELLERSQPAAAAVVTPILGPDEEALRELAALNKLLGVRVC